MNDKNEIAFIITQSDIIYYLFEQELLGCDWVKKIKEIGSDLLHRVVSASNDGSLETYCGMHAIGVAVAVLRSTEANKKSS